MAIYFYIFLIANINSNTELSTLKFGTQLGPVKVQIKLEDKLCESHMNPSIGSTTKKQLYVKFE